VIGILH